MILAIVLGLSLAPMGIVLAGPPEHSNAGGKGKGQIEESTEEAAPTEDGATDDGGSATPGSGGSGQAGSGDQGTVPEDTGGVPPSEQDTGSEATEQPEADDAEATGGSDTSAKKEEAARANRDGKPNPPGNNGTVKVDGIPFDDHPNNEPHVGCEFQIDFYGYDEGDLSATATFVLHPPTTSPSGEDVLLHDEDIFIGEDPAGGGTDLDASVTYDLSDALAASGAEAHPIQGYHIKLTVHAEGSIGSDVKHKVFWVLCEQEIGGQQIEVVKVWMEDGDEVSPPAGLNPSFRIVITGQGENTGTLTCRVADDELVCEGNLVINDPTEALSVSELNAPDGWQGPDEAFAVCGEEDDQGNCVLWEISIENIFVGGQQIERRFEVTKIWRGPGGDSTTPPPEVPEDLEIIFQDDQGNQLVCTRDGDTFSCEGFVDVETGTVVSVTEEPEVEGWLGPDTATASCSPETEDDVEVTTCTFEVVNLLEVLGEQVIRRIEKVWLDEDGNEVGIPDDLPAGFTLILIDPDEDGRLECTYQGTNLACTGLIDLEDGETLVVDEENAPQGWSGPQSVPVDCDTVEGEDGTITTCTVRVVNEFAGGGRPPEVLPRGPITPPGEVLAITGIEALRLLILGLAFLAGGAGLLAAERKRRRSER